MTKKSDRINVSLINKIVKLIDLKFQEEEEKDKESVSVMSINRDSFGVKIDYLMGYNRHNNRQVNIEPMGFFKKITDIIELDDVDFNDLHHICISCYTDQLGCAKFDYYIDSNNKVKFDFYTENEEKMKYFYRFIKSLNNKLKKLDVDFFCIRK